FSPLAPLLQILRLDHPYLDMISPVMTSKASKDNCSNPHNPVNRINPEILINNTNPMIPINRIITPSNVILV
ncbi:MAG: hypothetical protein Q4P17_11255, partial [Methanobacterium sp.]|nr:hypothetical protein [Methanobacterium sp.]